MRRGRSPVALIQVLESRLLLAVHLVSNANDSGIGSLRQAILDSNSTPGSDVIQFNTGVFGPVSIAPLSPLPEITGPIVVDGTTQPGYVDQPIVEINGAAAVGTSVNGLVVAGGNSSIRGLVINGFSGSGIYCKDLGGDVFENNFVGTDLSGTVIVANGIHGIILSGAGDRVGGTNPSQRNVISGNGSPLTPGAGILVDAKDSIIQGNFIGVDVSGEQKLPNTTGIYLLQGSSHTIIGGSAENGGNLISGNNFAGIVVAADSCTISGNVIGVDLRQSNLLANGDGIITDGSSSDIIGGTTAGEGNYIAGNGRGVYIHGGTGILVENNTITRNSESGVCIDAGTRHHITQNSIYENRGIGIDLSRDGVTANTPGGPHSGPNNLQNYPVLISAQSDGYATTIVGTLNSAPNSTFTLEFYDCPSASATGYGEGRTYLGSAIVNTNSDGNANFRAVVSVAPSTPGDVIAATATNDDSTSEFSADQFVVDTPPPTLLSTSVDDGTAQRSKVRSLTLTFDHAVTLGRTALSLDLLNTGGSGSNSNRPPTSASVALGTPTSTNGRTTWTIPIIANTPFTDATGSLADGIYTLTMHASAIMDANGKGLARGDQSITFHRLLGDINGSKGVNNTDFGFFRNAFNTARSSTAYINAFDFNNDGVINNADFGQFRNRFNRSFVY